MSRSDQFSRTFNPSETLTEAALEHYGGLVRAIAHRYPLPDGWERADIEQEGMIGLLNASRRYDPDGLHKNYPFPTVAAFAIKTQIRKALRTALGVEPPEIEEPTPAPDIADQPTMPLPLPIPTIAPAWVNSRVTRPLPVLSIDMPDPAPSVEEQVTAAVDGAQLSTALESALLLLSEKQRIIIARRYLDGNETPWTYEELGRELGCNKSTAWRNERKAMETLRQHLSTSRDGELQLIRLDEKRAARARKRAA